MTGAAARRTLFVDHAGVLGGAELSLLDIAAGLGPHVMVLLLADGPFRLELERRGIRVEVDALGAMARVRKRSIVPSPAALADLAGAARRLARRATGFEVLYANSQKSFVVAAAAGWLAQRPVIWHLRDILGAPHFSRTNARMVTWLANRCAAAVIANSAATATAFTACGGNDALVRVVHNGIDAAPFDAVTDADAHATRAALGPPHGVPVVVHAGRFHHWKGQHVLLHALALAPRVHAWIVGAPLFDEHAYEAELRALATSLGVADRVRFLGFRGDIPTLLKAADVVVHTSVYPEPFGRVVVEGMLAGRPVIAADSGGVREIVADGQTGVLVPPANATALAAAIRNLTDDAAAAAAMAARGAVHARARFGRDAMIASVREVVAGV